MPPHASKELADRLRPFATCFTAANGRHVLVLVAGALLAPGRRTVTAALRVMALDRTASFAVYHRVLSTARWSARAVAHRLLLVLVATFVRDGPVGGWSGSTTPSSAAGAPGSRRAASTATRCAPAAATSSRPAA